MVEKNVTIVSISLWGLILLLITVMAGVINWQVTIEARQDQERALKADRIEMERKIAEGDEGVRREIYRYMKDLKGSVDAATAEMIRLRESIINRRGAP